MDDKDRIKKIEAMQSIQSKAEKMLESGKDAFEVRDYVDTAKKDLAYKIPDEEAFEKAIAAASAHKQQRTASKEGSGVMKNMDYT